MLLVELVREVHRDVVSFSQCNLQFEQLLPKLLLFGLSFCKRCLFFLLYLRDAHLGLLQRELILFEQGLLLLDAFLKFLCRFLLSLNLSCQLLFTLLRLRELSSYLKHVLLQLCLQPSLLCFLLINCRAKTFLFFSESVGEFFLYSEQFLLVSNLSIHFFEQICLFTIQVLNLLAGL